MGNAKLDFKSLPLVRVTNDDDDNVTKTNFDHACLLQSESLLNTCRNELFRNRDNLFLPAYGQCIKSNFVSSLLVDFHMTPSKAVSLKRGLCVSSQRSRANKWRQINLIIFYALPSRVLDWISIQVLYVLSCRKSLVKTV